MSIQKLKKRAGMTFTGYQENHDQARNQIKRLLWTNHKTKSKLLLCNPGVLNPNYTLKKNKTHKSFRYLCQTPKTLLYKNEAYVSVCYKKLKRLM